MSFIEEQLDPGQRSCIQVEALRPLGLELLKTVLAKFGDARDPLLPEQLLLEQFQAQFVSALRYPSKPLTYHYALKFLTFGMMHTTPQVL